MITDGPTPEEIEAFVAGELPDDAAERVREAIVRDPRVAAEVEDIMQLRAAVAEVAPAPSMDAPVIPIAARRERRRRWMIAGGVAVAAAAGLIVWLVTRPPRAQVPAGTAVAAEVRGALAAHRGLEPRLSWSALDGHRPYDVARAAGNAGGETLPLALLARIEALKDPEALSAAQLAVGRVDEAARALEAAPLTADVASDRAAVALVRRDGELALVHAAAALALAPEHAQARWNRALALAQLGLDRSAAAAFDEIAARGEAGWSAEAQARATALRAQRKRQNDASAAADTAGTAFIAGGPPPIDLVPAFPDRMRLYFYDAVRAAVTAERLTALQPIAKALDAHFGETTLGALLDRVAASNLARRAPLAAQYAAVRASPDPAASALVAAATRAKADDIALGALLYTGTPPGVIAPAQLDLYRALAERGGDPWFALAVVEQRANLLFAADDVSGAESVLADGLERCKASRLLLRCQRIQRLLVHAYKVLHRFGAARRMLDDVLRSARETTTVLLENDLLQFAGAIALWRDDVRAGWEPVADAYLAEWALGVGTCAADRLVRETRATALINRHRNDEARAVFAGEPACPEATPSRDRLFVLAHLTAGDPQRLAALRGDIAAARAAASADEPERAFLDHVEGRALLDGDPAAARMLLRQAATTTATGPTADQARGYSYAALIDDAAARRAWAEAADLFAQELGDDRAAPCTLGASVDREETYVAMDASGSAVGARAPAPLDGGQGPVPAPVVAALAACDRVTVIGRGGYHGRPGLLPPDRPWSYRSRRARAAAGNDAPIDRGGPTLIVAGALPPARMLLPALAPLSADVDNAQVIEGAAATPDRVLAGMLDASYVELHAHGVLDAEGSAASFIALSPDAAGRFTLTAEAVAASTLRRRPVVVLAACHSGVSGTTHHSTGGLADAFVAAGARAVIASPDPIADADAERFFAGLRARIAAGTLPAQALRDERAAWTEPSARAWIDALVVIE